MTEQHVSPWRPTNKMTPFEDISAEKVLREVMGTGTSGNTNNLVWVSFCFILIPLNNDLRSSSFDQRGKLGLRSYTTFFSAKHLIYSSKQSNPRVYSVYLSL